MPTQPRTDDLLPSHPGEPTSFEAPRVEEKDIQGSIPDGSITQESLEDGLGAIEIVDALPALPDPDYGQGIVVFLTTDNKLYRSTGSAWTTAVPTVDLTGTISTTQLADGSVTTVKIGDSQVTTQKIGDSQITTAKIGDSQVTTAKVGDSQVTTAKIGDLAVTEGKIGNLAVSSGKIVDSAIITSKLNALAVTEEKVAALAITTAKIAALAVDDTKLAALAVTEAKIAASAVTTAKIADLAISTGKLAALAVDDTKLAALAVTEAKIAASAVTTAKIADLAIATGKLAALAVDSTKLAALAVTTAKIAADAVSIDKLEFSGGTVMDVISVRGWGWEQPAGAKRSRLVDIGGRIDVSGSGSSAGSTLVVLKRSDHTNLTYRRDGTGTGTLAGNQEYTVFSVDADRTALKDALIELRTNANGTRAAGEWGADILVILVSHDANRFNTGDGPNLVAELLNHGGTNALLKIDSPSNRYRSPYLLIGIPGIGEGRGIEIIVLPDAPFVPAEYSAVMLDGNLPGLGGYAAERISANMLQAGSVIAGKIAAGTIVAADIAALTITGAKIAAGTLTADKLTANTITANEIAANAITSSELAANAVIAGKIAAGTIVAADIAALTITAAQIAAGTITGAKIAATTITAANIQALTITAAEIAASTITGAKIAAGTITAANIAALTITAAEIAAGTITGAKIAATTITAANIQALTITGAEIAAGAITAAKIAANTITAGEIAANAITSSELAANAVIAGKIAAGTIVAADIAAGAITANEIAANTITAGQIAANAITSSELAAGAVVAGKIAAGTIVAADIAAGTITANEIAAATITGAKLVAGTITATQIATDAITADKILAGAVTAAKINVTSLSAIAVDAGEITAGQLHNAGDTAGVLLSGALPGTWTSYLDLTGDSGDSFLKHPKLDLKYDGSAIFTGAILAAPGDLTDGTNPGYGFVGEEETGLDFITDSVLGDTLSLRIDGDAVLSIAGGQGSGGANDLFGTARILIGSSGQTGRLSNYPRCQEVGNVDSTTTFTYTLPASAMVRDGDSLRITLHGVAAGSTTFETDFNASLLSNIVLNTNQGMNMYITLTRTSSTTGVAHSFKSNIAGGQSTGRVALTSLDWTVDNDIILSTTNAVDVNVEHFSVEYIPSSD